MHLCINAPSSSKIPDPGGFGSVSVRFRFSFGSVSVQFRRYFLGTQCSHRMCKYVCGLVYVCMRASASGVPRTRAMQVRQTTSSEVRQQHPGNPEEGPEGAKRNFKSLLFLTGFCLIRHNYVHQ